MPIDADVYFKDAITVDHIGTVGPIRNDAANPFVVGTAVGQPFEAKIAPVTVGTAAGQPFEANVGSVGTVGPVIVGTAVGQPFEAKVDIPNTFHILLEKIPSVRVHLPADFTLGLSLFGLDLLCVRLCGEAQVITEPYRPNPCEICGAEGTAQGPLSGDMAPHGETKP